MRAGCVFVAPATEVMCFVFSATSVHPAILATTANVRSRCLPCSVLVSKSSSSLSLGRPLPSCSLPGRCCFAVRRCLARDVQRHVHRHRPLHGACGRASERSHTLVSLTAASVAQCIPPYNGPDCTSPVVSSVFPRNGPNIGGGAHSVPLPLPESLFVGCLTRIARRLHHDPGPAVPELAQGLRVAGRRAHQACHLHLLHHPDQGESLVHSLARLPELFFLFTFRVWSCR